MTIQAMTVGEVRHLVERGYIHSSRFTWARETLKNADEANSTHVEFGVEWQGVIHHGVYRRTIADNGSGMSEGELVAYLNEFGAGSKTIGPRHENFGVGAKTSLLPWNQQGVVVLSWKDGEGSMIRLRFDPDTQNYGMHEYEDVNGMRATVVSPGLDPDLGIDFSLVKPDWIEDHGTVLVLLGNDLKQDTFWGDPTRGEDGIRGLAEYLNDRFWDFRNDLKVRMIEFPRLTRSEWPKGPQDPHQWRTITGTAYFAARPATRPKLTLLHGTVTLSDQTPIDWYLWDGPLVRGDYGPSIGTISLAYKNELYDITSHHLTFRSFGITEDVVRRQLFLVIHPKVYDEATKEGVWPQADRVHLRWGDVGANPPVADWGDEFRSMMPLPIIEALKRARSNRPASVDNEEIRKRLANRFAARFGVRPMKPDPNKGKLSAEEPDIPGPKRGGKGGEGPAGPGPHREPHKAQGNVLTLARPGNTLLAKRSRTLSLAMPDIEFIHTQIDDEASMAVWSEPTEGVHPTGLVQVWEDHPMFAQIIEFHQQDYSGNDPDEVREEVRRAYAEDLVCKVAHACHMQQGMLTAEKVKRLLTPQALTLAMLGLYSHDAVVGNLLRQRIGKKRKKAA
jgi:hypothetical protein